MYDSVYPTRTARFGVALVPEGVLKLKNSQFAADYRWARACSPFALLFLSCEPGLESCAGELGGTGAAHVLPSRNLLEAPLLLQLPAWLAARPWPGRAQLPAERARYFEPRPVWLLPPPPPAAAQAAGGGVRVPGVPARDPGLPAPAGRQGPPLCLLPHLCPQHLLHDGGWDPGIKDPGVGSGVDPGESGDRRPLVGRPLRCAELRGCCCCSCLPCCRPD